MIKAAVKSSFSSTDLFTELDDVCSFRAPGKEGDDDKEEDEGEAVVRKSDEADIETVGKNWGTVIIPWD